MPPKANTTVESRFWSKVEKTDSCWIWRASLNPAGYGNVRIGPRPGVLWLAHRLSWIWTHGDIPVGLCVLHRCDNRRCVNPDHMFLGTKADNSRDMAVKQRGTARFSAAEVQQIRLLARDVPLRELARRFDTSHGVLVSMIAGKTYKHVATDPTERLDFIRGEHHHNARLNEDDIAEIRRAYAAGGITQRSLAVRYGVNPQTISKIVRGERWHHVTDQLSL